MKKIATGILAAVILLVPALNLINQDRACYAKDMRALQINVVEEKAAFLEKAKLEKIRAEKEALEKKQRILADKNALKAAIAGLKNKKNALEDKNRKLKDTLAALKAQQKTLLAKVWKMEGDVRELVGFIRINAKEIDALLRQSLQSALVPEWRAATHRLRQIMNQAEFPGMDDIQAIVGLFFDEITRSGEVQIVNGPFVDRSGGQARGKILVLGNFTAAYMDPKETGFLLYSDKSQSLFALSKLPSRRVAGKIRAYMDGESMDVPIDMSKGAALRQLTHRLSLVEEIPKGGPIVWPIIGIAVLAVLIILERVICLFRKDIDAEHFVNTLREYASRQQWDECVSLCKKEHKKSIPRVLLAGLSNRRMAREDLENILQEAILNEIPKLERFLSTLGMLAAIAPLLGLLGTVTGMINTFHVITYYGTGDPRMMSGGISEALVTTMLGLAVAIPIMLCHTLLTRKVDNMIAQMEEKAVNFVNTIFKLREQG